ncbi:hypothetical protein D9M69_526910 [compost metagenome]
MRRRQVTVVAPARHHVAEVDHERTFDRRRVDPFAFDVAYLQATGGVLIEQGDAAVVGVRAGTLLLFGTGGVARRVMDHPQHADRLIEARVEEITLNPQRDGHCPQQRLREVLHVDVVLLHQRFPAGYGRMAIGAAQGLFRQYVRVLGR